MFACLCVEPTTAAAAAAAPSIEHDHSFPHVWTLCEARPISRSAAAKQITHPPKTAGCSGQHTCSPGWLHRSPPSSLSVSDHWFRFQVHELLAGANPGKSRYDIMPLPFPASLPVRKHFCFSLLAVQLSSSLCETWRSIPYATDHTEGCSDKHTHYYSNLPC